MPIVMLAVVGGVLGLLLYQWGRITGQQILAAFYAVAGAALGIMLATRLGGALGPLSLVLAATAGAIIVLYVAVRLSRPDKD